MSLHMAGMLSAAAGDFQKEFAGRTKLKIPAQALAWTGIDFIQK
jgi:hypothetical protein